MRITIQEAIIDETSCCKARVPRADNVACPKCGKKPLTISTGTTGLFWGDGNAYRGPFRRLGDVARDILQVEKVAVRGLRRAAKKRERDGEVPGDGPSRVVQSGKIGVSRTDKGGSRVPLEGPRQAAKPGADLGVAGRRVERNRRS